MDGEILSWWERLPVECRRCPPSSRIFRRRFRLHSLWCSICRRTTRAHCPRYWSGPGGGVPAEHPRDGNKIEPGRVYVAPPDFHLMVGKGVVRLSHGQKEHHNRPAIDPLFRSAAQVYGRRVVGVLLSGLLDDGVAGLKEIKRRGGLVIVQDPAEAMFSEMPRNALAKVEADYCLPVAKIRDLLMRWPVSLRIPRMPCSIISKPLAPTRPA